MTLDQLITYMGKYINRYVLASIAHGTTLFAPFVGPLAIYVFSDDDFVTKNAIKSINWSLSALIYFAISLALSLIFIGILMLAVLAVAHTLFTVIATVKASDGKAWSYPGSYNFV